MAPPSNRRPGYSRRAQLGIFTGYVAAVVGAIVGAVLLGISIFSPNAFAGARGLATDVAAPAGRAGAVARSETGSFLDTVTGYFAAGRQNAELRKELELARVKLVEAQAVAEENRRLKALIGISDGQQKPIAAARLVGSSLSSTRRFATISAGANQGVTIGMPIRSALGVIGRVLEVNANTARVLLITDTESVVPVRRASDGIAGFASGRSDGTLQIRLIDLGVNPLKRGDVMVTSGSGGLYHPGHVVAVVGKLLPDGAIAHVLADPAATEFVIVEQIWQQKVLADDVNNAPSSTPVQAVRK